jgi:hypothetical protein
MLAAVVVADIILVQLAVVTVAEHLLQQVEVGMVQIRTSLVLQDLLTRVEVAVAAVMVVLRALGKQVVQV